MIKQSKEMKEIIYKCKELNQFYVEKMTNNNENCVIVGSCNNAFAVKDTVVNSALDFILLSETISAPILKSRQKALVNFKMP